MNVLTKAAMLFTLSAFSSDLSVQSKAETVEIKVAFYCDHCKKCESCGARMENAVFTRKGIKRVDIDEQTKTLKIVYNPAKTSPEDIREAITKAGFDADDIKADPQAYEKPDDCCKK